MADEIISLPGSIDAQLFRGCANPQEVDFQREVAPLKSTPEQQQQQQQHTDGIGMEDGGGLTGLDDSFFDDADAARPEQTEQTEQTDRADRPRWAAPEDSRHSGKGPAEGVSTPVIPAVPGGEAGGIRGDGRDIQEVPRDWRDNAEEHAEIATPVGAFGAAGAVDPGWPGDPIGQSREGGFASGMPGFSGAEGGDDLGGPEPSFFSRSVASARRQTGGGARSPGGLWSPAQPRSGPGSEASSPRRGESVAASSNAGSHRSSAPRRADRRPESTTRTHEKQGYLLELEKMRRQGVRLTKDYTMEDSLEDVQFEYQRQQLNLDTVNTVNFMRDAMKLGLTSLELVNNRAGPFLDLDGWSQEVLRDPSRYDHALERLYKKYWRRSQMSPEMELLMLIVGSMGMFHFKKRFLGGGGAGAGAGSGGGGQGPPGTDPTQPSFFFGGAPAQPSGGPPGPGVFGGGGGGPGGEYANREPPKNRPPLKRPSGSGTAGLAGLAGVGSLLSGMR